MQETNKAKNRSIPASKNCMDQACSIALQEQVPQPPPFTSSTPKNAILKNLDIASQGGSQKKYSSADQPYIRNLGLDLLDFFCDPPWLAISKFLSIACFGVEEVNGGG